MSKPHLPLSAAGAADSSFIPEIDPHFDSASDSNTPPRVSACDVIDPDSSTKTDSGLLSLVFANDELEVNKRVDASIDMRNETVEDKMPVPNVSNADTSQASKTYLIQDLNPDIAKPWIFIGRVVARHPVRHYSNFHGNSKLIELYVSDETKDILRVTVFNDGVDSFHQLLQPGSSYSFSMGKIKFANDAFAPTNCAVEATFDGNSDIRPITGTETITKEPGFAFTPLNSLPILPSKSPVTIIGVIHETGGIKRVTTKKGKREKQEILLVDEGNKKVICTTWGLLARQIDVSSCGQILAIADGQISDYNNIRSINVSLGTTVLPEPALDRSSKLRDWYATLPGDHKFKHVTVNRNHNS